ncbi:ABC transporter permease [Ectopseudomonas oleovorans]|uniref:ABC transporter permease n=1 Tax=Ectopseudomonas oleovorans TaxID=301 RepID=UPI0035B01741
MQSFSPSPRAMLRSIWQHRGLVATMTRREIVSRYRGSFLGIFWSVFNPILMLIIYTFVFSVVFKARWSAGSESRTEFALMLFAGLMIFNFFAECLNRAPALILGNTNYVKKVVFPLEILPWVTLGSALFQLLVSLIVWLGACLILFGQLQLTTLLLPLIIVPLALLTLGLVWFIASLGVYLRDVSQIIGVMTSMLMFLSPIFYPITALPEQYQLILQINPLTPVVEDARAVLFLGQQPNWLYWSAHSLAAALVCWAGFAWFQKTRKGFADVL